MQNKKIKNVSYLYNSFTIDMLSVKALSTSRNYIVFNKKRFRKKINTKMFRIVTRDEDDNIVVNKYH